MGTTVTPDVTAAAEPSLAEAFGELANAIVAEESPETQAPSGSPTSPVTPGTPSVETPSNVPAPGTDAQQPAEGAAAEEGLDLSDDALKDAKPLEYTVDGATRQFEGIYVIPGQGAIIDPDVLPKVQDRLQQADRLVEQNRQLYQSTQEYQRIGGREAYEKLVATNALLDRAATIMLNAIQNEEQLLLLATDVGARQHLLRELDLSGREASNAARAKWQDETITKYTQQEQSNTQAQTAIGNATAQLAKNFPGLTTADVDAVRTHAMRVQSAIVRPANADEARAAGVRPGESIIDLPTLHMLLADRHELRKAAIATAQANAAANTSNAARIAAASPTSAKAPAARPAKGKAPAGNPLGNKPLDQMTSAEITRAMKTGRIFDLIGTEE